MLVPWEIEELEGFLGVSGRFEDALTVLGGWVLCRPGATSPVRAALAVGTAMSDRRPPRPSRLLIEILESRELPAATPWLVEAFQRGPSSGMPAGWSQWASDTSATFRVDPTAAGLGDQGRLVSSGSSTSSARAWLAAPYAANVEASAAVLANSLAPTQLLIRGQNLNTANASYYAVSVVRGVEVELVRVIGGKSTSLGRVKSADYVSGQWLTMTIRAESSQLRAFLYRADTNQFLGSDGKWTRQPVAAITTTDATIKTAGQVGFARAPRNSGDVALDSLRIGAPTPPPGSLDVEERFAGGAANKLPNGWGFWSSGSGVTVRTETDETLRVTATSAGSARAWLTQAAPADVQVSSSILVDSTIPAGIFARGSNLETATPTYYGLSVTRGLDIRLTRVVAGTSVELGRITSRDYVSGVWLQTSMVLAGTSIRVQIYRSDTGQYLNSDGTWGLSPAYALSRTDSGIRSGGRVGLTRGTGTAGQLVFDNFLLSAAPNQTTTIPTANDKPTTPTPPPSDTGGTGSTPIPTPTPTPTPAPSPSNPSLPAVPQHYSWIRLANLAYYGTPFGNFEQSLLRNSIDLVVPNDAYLQTIAGISPGTPQFVYTNVSNIYLGLLTDWNEYADRNKLNRESAFYHATKATPFAGMSASAVPVNHFWGVFRSSAGTWTNLTPNAKNSDTTLPLATRGESVSLGFLEKFREINVDLKSAAGTGWSSTIEYVAAVDSQGRPTLWKTLTLNSDGTANFRRTGTITFDPPKDWVAASLGGTSRLFYVRIRTTGTGTTPVARTILGRDYTARGIIPAFDKTADKDGDGYLSDAEYAKRRSGFDARFLYESRIFYPNYGPLRFATNVSNPGFRAWAVDYHLRYLKTQPLATGFFVDNSIGRLAVDPSGIAESLDGYPADYGSLLGSINKRLAVDGKWLLANTAGGGKTAEPIARNGVSSLEEFALRPLSANTVQFEDLAASVNYRREISGGRAYQILDTLPTNGFNINDPRMQLASLAMYYLVADPRTTFLMVNGGNEPASSWTQHWIPAVTYDVGKPVGDYTTFAAGLDPANKSLQYKVYSRKYENAMALYKPLSYTRGITGTTANNTATTHVLDGWYRIVNADGSLGARVNQVTLRNGEGVILAKSL